MDSRTTSVVEHVNGKLYMLTDIDAPRYRLVAVDPADPSNMALWSDVLPESGGPLESVCMEGSFGRFTSTTRPTGDVATLDGSNARVVNLFSEVGSGEASGGKMDAKDLYYAFTSFTQPTSIYKLDIATGNPACGACPRSLSIRTISRPNKRGESKDGGRVPMFIVHKKGLAMDGTNPRRSTGTAASTSA